ncbi:MAG: hypothetical protein WC827_02660 [Candidatus Paceibacterota bacterium]|jgi:hypothetical protein
MTNKEEILELETQGDFLFHGSSEKLDFLEPRQAYTLKDNQKVEDGKPAVFASIYSDIAIFMALINKENIKATFKSGYGFSNNKQEFRLTKEVKDKLTNLKGYLYVFNKSEFQQKNHAEYVSFRIVRPIKILEINESFLPKDINFI